MKRILILIIGLIGVAQAQYSPTSAKSRFVNGLALGTKLDSYFNAADSNAIYWRADSSLMAKYKGTARALAFAVSGGYLPISDTSSMLSNRLKISDTLTMLANRLKISDTAFAFSNYRRTSTKITNSDLANSTISGIALGSNLNNLTAGNGLSGTAYNGGTAYTWQVDTSTISTKANVTGALVGYTTVSRFTDSLTNVQSRIQTKQPLGAYITFADSTTILAGRWLPNRSADSIAVIRALANTKQPIGNYITFADSTTILAGRWLPNRSADSTAVLRALINTKGTGNGTVTSIATNTGTGITGGTITSTGTLAIDTATTISTKANVTGTLVGYTATGRFLDSLTNVQSRIQTKQPLGNYLTFADSSTILAGRWLPNRSSDSIAVIRALANSKGTGSVTSVATGVGLSGGTITTSGTISADTTTLSTRAYVTGQLVGYATTGNLALKLNISDTAAMLTPFVQYSDTANQMSGYQRLNFALLLQDTAAMLSNRLRISDTLTMLSNRLKISDTSNMLSPYARTANLPSLAPYLLKADSLSGGYTTWALTKKKIDSIGALKVNYTDTAAMLSGYKTYYPRTAISAGTGISYNAATGVITNSSPSSGGTVTSVATNNGSGITGGTITSTGTLAIDTTIISTKANVTGLLTGYTTTAANALKLNISDTATMLSNYRRTTTKITNSDIVNSAITINSTLVSLGGSINVGTVTSVSASAPLSSSGGTTPNITISQATTSTNGFLTSTDWNTFNDKASTASVALKLNISDTAAMMSKSFRTTTQVNDTTFTINRPDGTKDTIALSVQVPSTSQLVYNTALTTDADYSLGLSDTYVQLVSTSTPRTLTLPAASTCQGRVVILNSKVGGGSGWTSTQTIYTTYPTTGGVTSLNGSVDTIISNGTNWIFITRY